MKQIHPVWRILRRIDELGDGAMRPGVIWEPPKRVVSLQSPSVHLTVH